MICLHCGHEAFVSLFEIWDGRDFQIETCCEGFHEELAEQMNADPQWAAEFLRRLAVEDITGFALRRLADAHGQLILDWRLVIRPIGQAEAKAFVREHHRHCAPPAGWRYGAAIWNGPDLIGVVMVGRPVARMIDQTRVVEVNRLCVRDDVAPALVWNACSQLYGWAAREAKRRGFEAIITYALRSEAGTSLQAAGWIREGAAGGGSWHTPSRPRAHRGPTEPKVRWRRILCPTKRQAQRQAA